jgi:hypothetical protein
MTAEETKVHNERILLTAHALVQCGVEKDAKGAIKRVDDYLAANGNELSGSAPKNALKIAMTPQSQSAPKGK